MEIKNIEEIEGEKREEAHGEEAIYKIIFREFGKPLSLFRIELPPGATNQLHAHHKEDQIYMIQNGEGKMTVGSEEQESKAGDVIYLPSGKEHGFVNTGDEDCIIYAFGAI